MTDIAPIGSVSPGRVTGAGESSPRVSAHPEAAPPRRSPDKVELSSVASLLSKLRNLPVRIELVDSVRRQIADGTYESKDKLDKAVDEVIQDFG